MTPQKPATKEATGTASKGNSLLPVLAHLSILTVLLIGPFSMVIPLLIWLLERNKSPKSDFLEFQAKQAFFYQVAIYFICAILGILIGLLSIILVGLLFIPILIVFAVAAVVYGVYGGIRVLNGEDFRYVYVADFVEAGEKKTE